MKTQISRVLSAMRSRRAMRSLAIAPLLAMSVASLAACGDDDPVTPLVATTISISSGNNQTVQVSTAAALPLAVKVVDQNGTAMNGQTVTWAITAGGGTLSAATSTTDASGVAQITYTAGATAGAATITGTVASTLVATFAATVTAAP